MIFQASVERRQVGRDIEFDPDKKPMATLEQHLTVGFAGSSQHLQKNQNKYHVAFGYINKNVCLCLAKHVMTHIYIYMYYLSI